MMNNNSNNDNNAAAAAAAELNEVSQWAFQVKFVLLGNGTEWNEMEWDYMQYT